MCSTYRHKAPVLSVCMLHVCKSYIHAHTVLYVVSEYRHINQFVCACIMYVCDLHTYNIEYFVSTVCDSIQSLHTCTFYPALVAVPVAVGLLRACCAVSSPHGRCTGTVAARAVHARADCRFHSDHVEHVQQLDIVAAVGGNRRALLRAEV